MSAATLLHSSSGSLRLTEIEEVVELIRINKSGPISGPRPRNANANIVRRVGSIVKRTE